jgi:hypothetical protein
VEKATACLTTLETNRSAAIAVNGAKSEEAKVIKVRQQGFEESLGDTGL